MKIDPRHLNAVLAIVEHGTFSKAADALGVCQPALSKSISLLERRLGTKVFERSARGSTLTDAGRIVARRAESLDLLLTRVQEEIEAHARRLHGPLEIGATPSMMFGIVPEALARTAAAYPELVANIREGLDDELVPLLQRGEIDVLVGPVEGLHPAGADLDEIRLTEEPFVVGLPANHRLARKASVTLQDLTDEAWILPTPGSSFYRAIEAMFLVAGLSWPRNAITTNCLHMQERLIAKMGRIALLTPAHLMGKSREIATVALAGAPARGIGMKVRRNVRFGPATEEFVRQIRDVAQNLRPVLT
jgi:DNA-binding transcriptional LysR family regulator